MQRAEGVDQIADLIVRKAAREIEKFSHSGTQELCRFIAWGMKHLDHADAECSCELRKPLQIDQLRASEFLGNGTLTAVHPPCKRALVPAALCEALLDINLCRARLFWRSTHGPRIAGARALNKISGSENLALDLISELEIIGAWIPRLKPGASARL